MVVVDPCLLHGRLCVVWGVVPRFSARDCSVTCRYIACRSKCSPAGGDFLARATQGYGYRLFGASVFAGSSAKGWFVLPAETNALFLTAPHWREQPEDLFRHERLIPG